MKIEDDDDDLNDLYQSIDYDPFGDKAFDDYLDKRGKSLQAQSETFYKPQKSPKKIISSKELFAAQSVLTKLEQQQQSNVTESPKTSTFKVSKSGFKAMKIKKESTPKMMPKTGMMTTTQSNSSFEFDGNMLDIESYIAQQHEVSSSNNYNREVPLPSDNSPDPSTPIDIIENDSSPEPQRNSSFHVVKKTKPKRKKKKKDKKKKKRKKNKIKEMEPEDCTIRYEKTEETYTDKITKTIASIRLKTKPESTTTNTTIKNTNPFDWIVDENESENKNVNKLESTNPFANDVESVNVKKVNSTNPFLNDDLP